MTRDQYRAIAAAALLLSAALMVWIVYTAINQLR